MPDEDFKVCEAPVVGHDITMFLGITYMFNMSIGLWDGMRGRWNLDLLAVSLCSKTYGIKESGT